MTTLLEGDNRQVLLTLPDNSVDSIVTDPPYELGFMGKSWDSTGIAYDPIVWTQCLRVLKPGGHLLSFGGTRTYHRMVCAIEDAGFEIRDEVLWIYGSGFPKSLDISKQLDKAAGAEREKIMVPTKTGNLPEQAGMIALGATGMTDISEPVSVAAHLWQGWGTALKPAHEPICLARKPIDGTVVNNVLKWGVGGLNIDGTRIETIDNEPNARKGKTVLGHHGGMGIFPLPCTGGGWDGSAGRWPANLILDEQSAKLLDEQSGHLHGPGNRNPSSCADYVASSYRAGIGHDKLDGIVDHNGGGASRFFYSAKASGEDRNEGLEGMPDSAVGERTALSRMMRGQTRNPAANNHPTVKPVDLMCYLCRLITPKGGTVLDPFMGSGSTGKAAQMEGFSFIGIELDPEYMKIARARIGFADNLFTPKEMSDD